MSYNGMGVIVVTTPHHLFLVAQELYKLSSSPTRNTCMTKLELALIMLFLVITVTMVSDEVEIERVLRRRYYTPSNCNRVPRGAAANFRITSRVFLRVLCTLLYFSLRLLWS